MGEFQDIRLAFGESDEYSFVLGRDCQLYGGCALSFAQSKQWVSGVVGACWACSNAANLHAATLLPCRPPRLQAHLAGHLLLHRHLCAALGGALP